MGPVMTKRWEGKIRLPNGNRQTVTVEAESSSNAKALLEAQYGKANVYPNLTPLR